MNEKHISEQLTPGEIATAAAVRLAKNPLQPINTPIKRAGFCCLVAGLLVFIPGMFMLANEERYFLDAWWELMVGGEYNRFEEFWPLRIASFMAIAGLLLSYFYDIGIGRIIAWVKTGN